MYTYMHIRRGKVYHLRKWICRGKLKSGTRLFASCFYEYVNSTVDCSFALIKQLVMEKIRIGK